MRTRSRLLLAALGLAAAGLALGFTLTHNGPANALAQGPAGVLARGTFTTVTWATKGTVTIQRDGSGHVTFEVDLSQDVDLQALKGQKLTATLVSDNGQSETTFAAD